MPAYDSQISKYLQILFRLPRIELLIFGQLGLYCKLLELIVSYN